MCAHVPGSCAGICRGPWRHRNSSSSLEQTPGSQSAERGRKKERQKKMILKNGKFKKRKKRCRSETDGVLPSDAI